MASTAAGATFGQRHHPAPARPAGQHQGADQPGQAKRGRCRTKELSRAGGPKAAQAVPADQAKGTGAYAFHPSYKEATAMHPLDLGPDRVGVFAEVPGGWALRVLSLTEPGHQS